MEYIYAALLLNAAGKDITEDALNATVKAAGGKDDTAKAKMVVSSLEGVNIKEVLESAAAAPVVAAAPAAGAAKEAKKEEKKDDAKTEAQAAEGLSGLFG